MPPKKSTEPQVVPSCSEQETQEVFSFEEELIWCIKKLEKSLLSESINAKTLKSTVLALKTLKSNTAPFIKKRQVMRMNCGDYRKAMKDDLKKIKADTRKASLCPVKDVTGSVVRTSKSKKSNCKNSENDSQSASFCFNFPSPDNEDLGLNVKDLKISS